MSDTLLALNAGSSSIKFALYTVTAGDELTLRCHGALEDLGNEPHFQAATGDGCSLADEHWNPADADAAATPLLAWINDYLDGEKLRGVGHRIVHGGVNFRAPVRIDDGVIDALEQLVPLAPLHQPHNLAPVRTLRQQQPELFQVACFDTSFHHTMPELAKRLALPRRYTDQGLQRFGFHGLSYAYIASKLREEAPKLAAGRVIVAHLGNGASLCAMRNRRSVDTTMGLTALDGLMMGTRAGQLDPGVVLYLQQQLGVSVDAVADLLYHQSGLLGVSGISNDARQLLASNSPLAREAIELFVFRLAREAGAMAASLDGVDGLVFSAGIGEHAAPIRAAACRRLAWLGIELDEQANTRGDALISTATSRVQVRIVPTDEERMIARHTLEVLRAAR